MRKAQRVAYTALALALDATALLTAFLAAWALRDSLDNLLLWGGDLLNYPVRSMVRRLSDLPPTDTMRIALSPDALVNIRLHLWVLYLSIPMWLFFMHAQGGYDPTARRNSRQEFALCAYAGLLGMMTLLVFMFLAKFVPSRLLVVSFLIVGIGALWLERTVLLPLIQRRARQPIRNLIVIGSRAAMERFAAILQTPAYHGSRLLGYISDEQYAAAEHEAEPGSSQFRHLGTLSDLEGILDREVVDEVMIVRSQADIVPRGQTTDAASVWSHVLELCLQRGRTVSLVDDMVPPVGAKVEATMMGTLPTFVLHNTPQDTLPLALKSLMDRVIAFFALVVLALPMAIIALAIKITAPGPVFFRQKRVGLNGRQFWFYKFRSMINNAEKFKEEHPELFAGINTMSGPFFKSEDDPRITRVGRFLRKYSLDELPQFWNVLRGDMSLVGPRPPLPREVEQLEPWQRRKLSVKGGLTCLWQVSGRNEIDTDEWMRLDLEYIDNWSLWLDVKLLFKTLKVLVKPKGAKHSQLAHRCFVHNSVKRVFCEPEA